MMECLVEETPVLPRKVSVPGNYPGMLYIHHGHGDEDDEEYDEDDDDDDDDVNAKNNLLSPSTKPTPPQCASTTGSPLFHRHRHQF